jgi:NAD(P)-dependent dehydrogenase (short-subunit alcohol dehydrogenase family)
MVIGSSARPDLPVALVVGSGGLGMVTARRLAQRHRVVLASLTPKRLEERCAVLRAEGFDVTGVPCDLTSASSVQRLADTVQEVGPLKAVAHVAALSPSMGDWGSILAANLGGSALLERAMLAVAGQGTAAVFVSSLSSRLISPDPAVLAVLDDPLATDVIDRLEALVDGDTSTVMAYNLSKVALNRLCERRAQAWGLRGARIVSISPGLIASPMGALEFRNRPMKMELYRKTPLAREGTMVEVADAIEFLASDRASFITGTDLLVDGGVAAVLRHEGGERG